MGERDERARLEALFVEHASAVSAYARRRGGPSVADDVVSEVFAVAWRRRREVPDDALPWLLACARRVLANHRRGDRRRVALAERLSWNSGVAQGAAVRGDGALARALASLGERDREVLLLIAWEELSAERAAVVVGCSRRTFAVRLHRARRRLSRALDADRSAESAATMEATR